MWLRFYVEYKIGVCIIDTFPHCLAEMLSKGTKSRNVALFLYSGTMEYHEYVSSIVFHTVILNKLSKEAKNQEMWLHYYIEDKFGVCIINSIPHCFSKHFSTHRLPSYSQRGYVLPTRV